MKRQERRHGPWARLHGQTPVLDLDSFGFLVIVNLTYSKSQIYQFPEYSPESIFGILKNSPGALNEF